MKCSATQGLAEEIEYFPIDISQINDASDFGAKLDYLVIYSISM